MRVALKVYLAVERLMIEHDTLPTTTEAEECLIERVLLDAWSMLTREERLALRERVGATREETNPTKVIFEGDVLYSAAAPVPLRVCAHRDLGSVPVHLSAEGVPFEVCAPTYNKAGKITANACCGLCGKTP